MRVYWAGAAFWLEADLALRGQGQTLDSVLSQYARCCLRATGEVAPEVFVADLDRLAGGTVFSDLHARYAESTRFPDLDRAYSALGLDTRGGALQLSARPAARELRRALMGLRDTP